VPQLIFGPGANCRSAFTLVEVMIAVLLMALLASAAALSFSGSLRSARSTEALERLRSFDSAARDVTRRTNREARIVFDLSNDTLSRREGTDLDELTAQVRLPTGYRIDELRIPGQSFTDGEAVVDCSALGVSRTYAVHLVGPGLDHWVLVAGLTGEMTQEKDESATQSILDRAAPVSFRSWDNAAGHDAH
jgi:prepilin-type N-terminal cleavage/methylation domain-containing protein